MVLYCEQSFYIIYIDIDECAMNRGGCEENCTNTNGSFVCACHTPGYEIGTDGLNCIGNFTLRPIANTMTQSTHYLADIDECRSNEENNCIMLFSNSKCNNTDGSYTCVCADGYLGNVTNCTSM